MVQAHGAWCRHALWARSTGTWCGAGTVLVPRVLLWVALGAVPAVVVGIHVPVAVPGALSQVQSLAGCPRHLG